MKTITTQVAIIARDGGNAMFDCIHVGPDTVGAGSFIKITGNDEMNDGATLRLDWEEWDALVETVAKHRSEWEWSE